MRDLLAALLGGVLVDDAGVQVGINRHLFAGHGIQGESGGDLRDASRALGDHRKVDQDQDAEDHDAHQVIAGDHEFAKGLYDLAGGIGAGVALNQDHPGGGHIQGQAQHGGQQNDSRKGGEVERPLHPNGHHDDDQAHQNVEGEEQVQQQRWQGQHQHGHDEQHQGRNPQSTELKLHCALS